MQSSSNASPNPVLRLFFELIIGTLITAALWDFSALVNS